MKKKIYPKSRILASSVLKKTLTQKISELVESTFEDNLAQQISSSVPDYDLDWCPEEYDSSSKEEKELQKARDLYIQAVVNSLLANAPEDIKSATKIQGSSSEWTYLSSKSVPDSDGFYTDYTLYTNLDRSKFICMFGDNDLYEPDEDYADFETESEDEAWEWFNSYEGITDDDEDSDWMNDIMSSTSSSSQKYWYFTRHGVMPGSVPKYINILDVIDKPEGSYFLADGIIKTEDLKRFEIKERSPKDVQSSTELSSSFVLRTDTWSEMIQALEKEGYSVDAAYRRKPEKWVGLIKNNADSEEDKYWVAEVTQYFAGDYEVRSDNLRRDHYFE